MRFVRRAEVLSRPCRLTDRTRRSFDEARIAAQRVAPTRNWEEGKDGPGLRLHRQGGPPAHPELRRTLVLRRGDRTRDPIG